MWRTRNSTKYWHWLYNILTYIYIIMHECLLNNVYVMSVKISSLNNLYVICYTTRVCLIDNIYICIYIYIWLYIYIYIWQYIYCMHIYIYIYIYLYIYIYIFDNIYTVCIYIYILCHVNKVLTVVVHKMH